MFSVIICEARERLSELIEATQRGETVSITRRGRKVACLTPFRSPRKHGLPDLTAFRSSLQVSGQSPTQDLIDRRDEERS